MTPETIAELAGIETGRLIEIFPEWLAQQLDPRVFVAARAIPGGPAPSAMTAAIGRARARLDEDRRVIDAETEQIETAARERASRTDRLIKPAPEAQAHPA